MADMREVPLVFSLKGFEALEKQRLRAEAAERGRAEAEQARVLAEIRMRQERAEVEVRRQAELSVRERAARLDALRLAAVERARIEAEAAARLEELESRHAHAQRMQKLTEESKARASRRVAVSLGAVLVASLAVVVALYVAKWSPESRRLSHAYDKLVLAERERGAEVQRLLAAADAERARLRAENTRLRRELERRDPPKDQ